MDQTLVTQDDAKRLADSFNNTVKQLVEYYEELRKMKLGVLKANLALEYSKEARRFIDAVEASELRDNAKKAHELHTFMTRILTRVKKPAEILIKYCQDIRSDYEVERRRSIEAERRKREEEANRLAAEQRKAEVEHLKDIGRSAQAEALAAAPVIPQSVNVDLDAGKPAGEIMVEVWAPRLDEQGDIVFSDCGAFLHWVADRPEFYYLVKPEYGKLKKLLTQNRGNLLPPGLEVEKKFEPRTRIAE